MSEEEDECIFCEETWQKLPKILKEIKTVSAELVELRLEFDDNSPIIANIEAEDYADHIVIKDFRLGYLKKRIKQMNKLCLSKKRLIVEVNEKLEKKNNDFMKLAQKTSDLGVQSRKSTSDRKNLSDMVVAFARVMGARRSILIQEIIEVFKLEIDGGPASVQHSTRERRECRCVLIDTIRNLHLPHLNVFLLPGHEEIETNAALGYLIHAVDLINILLRYAPRYPFDYGAEFAHIENPLEDKMVFFYGGKRRYERERILEALSWLGKNVAQLRSDSGIPTPVADKTLSILVEWTRVLSGGSTPLEMLKNGTMCERPFENIYSPASIFYNYE